VDMWFVSLVNPYLYRNRPGWTRKQSFASVSATVSKQFQQRSRPSTCDERSESRKGL